MKNKKDIILIDKIAFIVIIITIILLNLYIGSNIKAPIWIIQMLISVFSTIFILVKKIQKEKNIIIKGKIDIAVFLLMISTILPYIFRTYTSLESCINFIIKYWAVFGFYILVRNIIIDNKKLKILINTIIISSVIPIIFGIDKLTFNICIPFLDLINSVKIEDYRMISIFGYANTFAVYLCLTISLAISELFNSKNKKIKIIYIIYILIAMITMILTQSKAVFALVFLIIAIIILKNIKEKKINKKLIISGVIGIIIFFVYFFIAIQISKPLKIINEEKNCVIRGIESNTNYEFVLDLKAETEKEYDVFEITIVEVTRYLSEKVIGRMSFSNYEGKKRIEVTTNDDIEHIEIRIKNKLNQEMIINSLTINDSPYILEYKIIPEEVVRIFKTFNFKNSSVWQRADYWNDCLEIVKNHFIIGSGGDAWRTSYGQVQDYLYYAKECHSYILELWASFGILGVLSYIFVISITILNVKDLLKKLLKEDKSIYRNFFAIAIGIAIISMHSVMDFDMSYLIIEVIFYMFIAILNKDDKIEFKYGKILEICVLIILTVVSIGNIRGFIASLINIENANTSTIIAPWIGKYKYNKIIYVENKHLEDNNEIKYIKKYIEDEPYKNQNTMYEIMSNKIIKNIENKDINTDDIEFIIKTWKNIKRERKYEINTIQDRIETMFDLAEALIKNSSENKELKNYAREIINIIKDEYESNTIILLDYRKNLTIETLTKYKYEYYINVYNKAIELENNLEKC